MAQTHFRTMNTNKMCYSDASQNSPQATNFSYIKQYPNQSGLRATASTSNIEILEYFQSKALCMIVHTPLYVPNMVVQSDLEKPTVKEEIRRYSSQCAQYSAHHSATQMT
jgi:hypothetical protein